MVRRIVFTEHAKTALAERNLLTEWVERVVTAPQWTEPDRLDPAVMRYFGAIPERGGRFLRVAAVETDGHFRVVSVFLDRRARPK